MANYSNAGRVIFMSAYGCIFILIVLFVYSSMFVPVQNGTCVIDDEMLQNARTVPLNGKWEFYWNKLLTPDNFRSLINRPIIDSYVNVPGSWHDKNMKEEKYLDHGVATYRINIKMNSNIDQPAIKIKRIVRAYKLYSNGKLLAESGVVSATKENYKAAQQILIIDLPKDQNLELIFQVANWDFARGGLRESPVIGSRNDLEHDRMMLMTLQLLLIGSTLVFCIYYLIFFLLHKKNMTALFFSLLCFNTTLRVLVWGEIPGEIIFPGINADVIAYVNIATAYLLMPIIIMLLLSFYPDEYKKKHLPFILFPLLFSLALLFVSVGTMSLLNDYLFLMIIIQNIYLVVLLVRVVLNKSQNAILMFITFGVMFLVIIFDILGAKGKGPEYLPYLSLIGSLIVTLGISLVQARQHSSIDKKLQAFNQNLIESGQLKDKIMATELSFLHAQIKPHFLYNALDAIANVCEKDGVKASGLILDLATYLRGSLEFNQIDKMSCIENELEYIKTYFNIEQERFGDKIKLLIQNDAPLDFPVPMLLLQPLVENAIRHGISKSKKGGIVMVSIKSYNDYILIEIEDDGVGIDPAKIESILENSDSNGSIGLNNINLRLIKFYGSGLNINVGINHGTKFSFKIHKRRLDLL